MKQEGPGESPPITLEERYPNIKAVIILSASFFVLFLAFFSSANSSSKALRDSGFNNMGFYSLSVLYLNFGLSSLWTPKVVIAIHPKKTMVIASVLYSLWIISLALTTAALKTPSIRENLSYNAVCCIVLTASLFGGAGCSLLWMAQGKYLTDCAEKNLSKKGFYSSVFWTTMFLS